MAKGNVDLIEVKCPCCETILEIDPQLKAVIRHTEKVRPPVIEDLQAAVQRLKGEEARRAELFQKSMNEHKNHSQVLNRKFDELLKQAKDGPVGPPPKRPFELD